MILWKIHSRRRLLIVRPSPHCWNLLIVGVLSPHCWSLVLIVGVLSSLLESRQSRSPSKKEAEPRKGRSPERAGVQKEVEPRKCRSPERSELEFAFCYHERFAGARDNCLIESIYSRMILTERQVLISATPDITLTKEYFIPS